jgi:hypothetical protein
MLLIQSYAKVTVVFVEKLIFDLRFQLYIDIPCRYNYN